MDRINSAAAEQIDLIIRINDLHEQIKRSHSLALCRDQIPIGT
jgi:hypothetical protein